MGMLQPKFHPPMAFTTSYAPRLRSCNNALLVPVVVSQSQLRSRRGTAVINYNDDGMDSDFEDDDEAGARFQHRSARLSARRGGGNDPNQQSDRTVLETGIELAEPAEFQPIWRDWIGRPKRQISEKQAHGQAAMPLQLIPIRIDLEIPAFRPEPPYPTPGNAREFGIDESLKAYRPQEMTPPYRLKDFFLWNLHEVLITPDQFARVLIDDLDMPAERKSVMAGQIAGQIRQQLEEYAGISMHPLFHPRPAVSPSDPKTAAGADKTSSPNVQTVENQTGNSSSVSAEPESDAEQDEQAEPAERRLEVTAELVSEDEMLSADDMYRCVISLNINILDQLYTDKFEWSLLHPPGFAEQFARVTCADLGLNGEWAAAITHAIYEAVLRLKKDACESGGVGVAPSSGGAHSLVGELHNDAADGTESGWRYDNDRLCDDWEPKLERLQPDEIEKREGDRERQLRRMRRETARYSSVAALAGMSLGSESAAGSGMQSSTGLSGRSRRRTRARSNSPLPAVVGGETGYGGGNGFLTDTERASWRCAHCAVWGSAVWAVRDGPHGPRTLCNNCGLFYERHRALPPWTAGLFEHEKPAGKA